MGFRYLRPDKLMTLDSAVTGTVASGYEPTWLCDLRVGFPVRSTVSGSPAQGDLALTVVGTSRLCNFAAATHLKLDDAVDIVLGGGITATLEGRGDQADRIPLNRWATFSPVTAGGCTVTVTDNTGAAVIGELFVGEADTLARPLHLGASHGYQSFSIPTGSEFSSLNPYSKGVAGETLSGMLVLTDDELAAVKQWFKSCDDGALPTVIVPDDTVDDCLVVRFEALTWTDRAPGDASASEPGQQALYDVNFTFRELPRGRW